jgi:chloramphenicol 3-O-phosphotransferase
VLAYVIERAEKRDAIAACIPGAEVFLVQLRARTETLQARLRTREISGFFDRRFARAKELAAILEKAPADLRLDTDDLTVTALAADIIGRIDWA